MSYITCKFGAVVAKPKGDTTGKILRRPFTEAEYAKAWKKLAKSEGHAKGLPKTNEYPTPIDRNTFEAQILSAIGETPVLTRTIAELIGRRYDSVNHALLRLTREGRVRRHLLPSASRAAARAYSLPVA